MTVINSVTDDDDIATSQFTRLLKLYYQSESYKASFADDFVLLSLLPGKTPILYVYWNIGVKDPGTWEKANRESKLQDLPPAHSAIYAPAIEPTLQTGIEALASSALAFEVL